MDEFDQLNASNIGNETNSNELDDDLLGSDFTMNTTVTTSNNLLDNESTIQQPDLSWMTDDNLTGTTIAQTNIYDDDVNTSATEQMTSFDNDLSTNELNTQDFQSYSTSNFPSKATNEYSYDDFDEQSKEDSSSFNIYNNSPSSSSFSQATSSMIEGNASIPKDNLSVLHAFNARRQQEIAEMDVIEKKKIDELRQQAKKDLEHWYEERRLQMERKQQSIRQEQDDSLTKASEKSDKNTCDWAKVIRLLEFSQGSQITKQKRDISRMRAVIIQSKRNHDGQKSENGV